MRRAAEKAKRPTAWTLLSASGEPIKAVERFEMEHTANQKNAQACEAMFVYLKAITLTLIDTGDDLPCARRLAISRLAEMMREQISAAEQEAPLCLAREDEEFQSFKSKLTKKPRKNSKLAKSLELH